MKTTLLPIALLTGLMLLIAACGRQEPPLGDEGTEAVDKKTTEDDPPSVENAVLALCVSHLASSCG